MRLNFKKIVLFLSQTQSKLILLFSDYHDAGDNQDMHSYFRQASVNLKEILKNPGVWDPFILSYVEVSTQSQPAIPTLHFNLEIIRLFHILDLRNNLSFFLSFMLSNVPSDLLFV